MAADAQSNGTQAEGLAATLRREIQESPLEDGDFFMTESDLAETYGVSRTVAREAVGRLKSLGMLEGRKRKGLIIRRPDPLKLLTQTLPSLVSNEDDLRELGMLRYALEVGSIELAIRNTTEDQIQQLSEVVSQMEVAFADENDVENFVELDVQFHALILAMTGSRMISGMRKLLVDFFIKVPRRGDLVAAADRMIWEHRELYEAIQARDVERARTMIRMHCTEWFRDLPDDTSPNRDDRGTKI
ncbi:FadR/GntR family transcriptional regulator [Fuerstiella marisgermanici]|uniref:L-lactate utilization operon repressor n=1 Tax=Fuerstiella marisgermanici TaxID=1891926 RepID=A0A1P8WR50_9PLAN|nr:FCD domain-containing protein [Fuerstiella marisgermanici]APZ96533.1 L-lactate utilization operon repressor [Fuerstiella marisgermanici]